MSAKVLAAKDAALQVGAGARTVNKHAPRGSKDKAMDMEQP